MKQKVVCYVLTAVLLVFYIVVLFRSLDTRGTTDAYRMYYLSDDLQYYVSQDELQSYGVNTPFAYQKDGKYKNQGKGWSKPEDEGTWLIGPQADVYFYVADSPVRFTFRMEAEQDTGYQADLCVNEQLVGALLYEDGYFYLDISQSYMKEG